MTLDTALVLTHRVAGIGVSVKQRHTRPLSAEWSSHCLDEFWRVCVLRQATAASSDNGIIISQDIINNLRSALGDYVQ